jgi:hypothetical protein
MRVWPKPRVWCASILYLLAIVTPSTIERHPGQSAADEFIMGWETAFASVSDVPDALRRGQGVLSALFAPAVNALFITAVSLDFAATRGGERSHVLRKAATTIGSGLVPLAVIGVVLFVFEMGFGAGWGGYQARPGIGMYLWIAAYLTLGLRLWRRSES